MTIPNLSNFGDYIIHDSDAFLFIAHLKIIAHEIWNYLYITYIQNVLLFVTVLL